MNQSARMKHNRDMKRTSGGIWGLAAAALIACAVAGCKGKPEPKYGVLSKDVEVPLILIKELQAGADAVGTIVPFMAAEDAVDPAGNVVVRKGAVAYGKVVRSRAEGTLSALVNQPARLEITIFKIEGVDRSEIKLSAVKGGAQTEPLELNRANTGKPDNSQKLDQAWDNEEYQQELRSLAQLIQTSKNSDLSANPATSDLLKKLSTDLDLRSTAGLKDKSDVDKVARMLGQIATGQNDLEALGAASMGQLGAVIELTKVVGYVGNRLGDALKGRTIRAHVGTPLKAYVVEEVRVRLPEEE
jgi:hypothetical protein